MLIMQNWRPVAHIRKEIDVKVVQDTSRMKIYVIWKLDE